MKVIEIIKFAEEYLAKYSFSKPRLEAEKMLADVLKLERLGLYINYELELSQEDKEKIKNYLKEMGNKKMKYEDLKKEPQIDYRKKNQELFLKSIDYLKEKGVQDYKLDTEYIFSHVLKINRNFLNICFSKEITKEQIDEIKKMLIQRGKNRKPLQQILGEWEFYGYKFFINENILIPRSDTEILVEQCKFLMIDKKQPKILDIGTGSGAISIVLAKELPESRIIGVDISEKALEIAEKNRILNNAGNLKFLKSDIFSKVDEKFDLIVSNPPYIPLSEYEELMIEVKEHEPRNALTDNGDGYFFYEKISREAKEYLDDGGYLAFEVGYNQAFKVSEFMERNGFTILKVVKDYAGIERVVIGIKNGEKNVDKIN